MKPDQVFKKLCTFSLFELGFHTNCLCIGLNFPPYIDKVLYFHIPVVLEYLVSAESRRPLKPVLGGMHFPFSVMQRLSETESSVLQLYSLFLLWNDPFSHII